MPARDGEVHGETSPRCPGPAHPARPDGRGGPRAGERGPDRRRTPGALGRAVVRAVLADPAALDRVPRHVAAVPPDVLPLRRRLGRVRRVPARRAGQHGLLRAAAVPVPDHRGLGDRHAAHRGRVVRLHDHPGGPALAVVPAVRRGRAPAGRRVPVAQLSHAPDRRAPDPAAAPAAPPARRARAVHEPAMPGHLGGGSSGFRERRQ